MGPECGEGSQAIDAGPLGEGSALDERRPTCVIAHERSNHAIHVLIHLFCGCELCRIKSHGIWLLSFPPLFPGYLTCDQVDTIDKKVYKARLSSPR